MPSSYYSALIILPDFIAQPGKKKISEIENLVEIRIIIVAIWNEVIFIFCALIIFLSWCV